MAIERTDQIISQSRQENDNKYMICNNFLSKWRVGNTIVDKKTANTKRKCEELKSNFPIQAKCSWFSDSVCYCLMMMDVEESEFPKKRKVLPRNSNHNTCRRGIVNDEYECYQLEDFVF